MAIAFRASSTTSASTTAGTSVTITIPSAVQVNDLMIVAVQYQAGSNVTQNTPAGWTEEPGGGVNGSNMRLAVFTKIAVSGDTGGSATAAFSITGGTNRDIVAAFAAYSGVDTTTPTDAATVGNSLSFSGTMTTPSITTVTANTMIVSVPAIARGGTAGAVLTAASGQTERVEAQSGTGTSNGTVAIGDKAQAVAGNSGQVDWTASASDLGYGMTLALRPSAGATISRTATPVTVAVSTALVRTATPVTVAVSTALARTATPATVSVQTTLARAATPVTVAVRATLARTATPVTISVSLSIFNRGTYANTFFIGDPLDATGLRVAYLLNIYSVATDVLPPHLKLRIQEWAVDIGDTSDIETVMTLEMDDVGSALLIKDVLTMPDKPFAVAYMDIEGDVELDLYYYALAGSDQP